MASHATEDFSSKYTNANLAPDAAAYNSTILCGLVRHLEDVDGGSISAAAPGIIASMLCAQRRGDAVPKLFRDLAKGKTVEDTKALFASFKLALNLTWAFSGLPQCIPACLGLVGELRELGISGPSQLDRAPLTDPSWLEKGQETNRAIYRAVGNAEVGQMVHEFFPEISYVANVAVFGFLIGGSEITQNLPLCEITVAGAIAALGATRQARSHLKGSMGLGISVTAVEAVLRAAESTAAWNGGKLPGAIDVAALAEEVKANLKKLDGV
ncbi:hypothetical protein INS49_001880 [Diaporthe citri]|uniref:uncharacterized protein n=1 Tax=Diaporthe citri TaxID=83186 RepID=UPI001C7FCBA6|nr:uncharacterized protein INS49_001880 [Diaporthe citri]KAG6367685.1 hypothetical protein INS49_001880 [Diaporthe citri]